MTKHLIVCAIALAACGGTKRSTTVYRADTQQLLATRDAQIRECYEKVLVQDATARGTLTVSFTVEKKTGKFVKTAIDPNNSNAPEPIVLCVTNAIEGLQLQPPDKNEGKATFVYALNPATP